MTVHIYATPHDLAVAAADVVASYVGSLDRHVTLGLAGGRTPTATYAELATRPVDWSQVTLWLGDERWVPHDHPDSNTRMVHATLADRVVAQLIAPDTAFGDPAMAAAAYGRALTAVFHDGRPDLVLLGVGPDGHTASLFPNTDALATGAGSGSYLANWVEAIDAWRLTASLDLLGSAREIVFIAQGQDKSDVLAQIIDDGHPYPAQLVADGASKVRWMLDAAAAARLRTTPT